VLGRIERVQPFEREGWTGAVADETLDPGTVLTFDAHGGVDAEPARALPGEDAGGGDLVEQSVATEVAKDASLEDRFHMADVLGRQLGGPRKNSISPSASLNTPSRTMRW
jgi:hypothetical protein